jgi:hypothetical protein
MGNASLAVRAMPLWWDECLANRSFCSFALWRSLGMTEANPPLMIFQAICAYMALPDLLRVSDQ